MYLRATVHSSLVSSTAGRGDRLTQTAALATEAAVFRGTDAIQAGLADALAGPVTAFRTFAAAPSGTTSPSRKGLQMTTKPTDTPTDTAIPRAEAAAPTTPEPPVADAAHVTEAPASAAPAPDAAAMTAETIRAEASEVAQVWGRTA